METTTKVKRIHLKRIELSPNEDVYDITVKNNHNFFANGLLVHNCAEISLKPNQFCNLTEINDSDIESQEDLNARARAAAFIGTLQAGYTDFHYLREIWKETTESEALIGVGQTGIASGAVLKLNLEEAAKCVLEENERVAKLIGINVAARTTTVKPSGCLSESTKIRTNRGDLSLREIFLLNDIDVDKIDLGFIGVKEQIYVYDENNNQKLITKLFNNGIEETLRIDFEDGNYVECTNNHKFLTKNGWKRADELLETDEIVSF